MKKIKNLKDIVGGNFFIKFAGEYTKELAAVVSKPGLDPILKESKKIWEAFFNQLDKINCDPRKNNKAAWLFGFIAIAIKAGAKKAFGG